MRREPELLCGRYRVDRLLARGGLADIWAAEDLQSNCAVALKVLRLDASELPEGILDRFEQEARLLQQLDSPHLCRLLAVGRTPEDCPFLVLELLSGETLGQRLERESFLPFEEVAVVVSQVLEGLVLVHEAGIVHRDLSPSNIFLAQCGEEDERAVVLDFGVSKLRRAGLQGSGGPVLTSEQSFLGSLAYAAPEQIDCSAKVDARADLYALGAIMFRALSGRAPFEGLLPPALSELKRFSEPPSLSRITGDRWPVGVEDYLRRALARLPNDRFPSAKEALEALRALQKKSRKARLRRSRKPRVPGAPAGEERTSTRTYTRDPSRDPDS